ncbi:MAG: hypothetical protein ACI3XA_02370 [Clostridia bacterium]
MGDKMFELDNIANKVKEKAAEVTDKVKELDCKDKAEEAKEKVADMADKVKSYDYKSKAKEVSETVKNYDYKSEAENIKKGGIKYFWNRHKKLSIIAIAVVLLFVVIPNFMGNGVTEKTGGYVHFEMTKNEFVKKYNNVFYDLSGSEMYNPSKYPVLDENFCSKKNPEAEAVEMFPNVVAVYDYDTTLYTEFGQMKNAAVSVYVDGNDNVVSVVVSRSRMALGTEEASEAFVKRDCASVLSAITGESGSACAKKVDKLASKGDIEKEGDYEYLFVSTDAIWSFVVRVVN